MLEIHCRKCNTILALYQKDGPGNLRRMYLDRIISPAGLAKLQYKKLGKIPNLRCRNCGETLGIPYIYEKERRKAFRLFQDAVTKKIRKLSTNI